MDVKSINLRVPNAIFFIRDAVTKDVPSIDKGVSIWSSPTCVAVGCVPDADGETKIVIGAPGGTDLARQPAFDGTLQTPSRLVNVDIVPGEKILEQQVPGTSTRIRVWVNDPIAPDRVMIGLD